MQKLKGLIVNIDRIGTAEMGILQHIITIKDAQGAYKKVWTPPDAHYKLVMVNHLNKKVIIETKTYHNKLYAETIDVIKN